MTVVRRATQVLAIVVLVALGVVLVLDATGATDARWRDDAADVFRSVVLPDLSQWVVTLIGAGLAIVGLVMLVAQLVPPRRGGRRVYEVHSMPDGDTHIRGRAVLRAVRHVVEAFDHVTAARARWTGNSVRVEMHVDDEANVAAVEQQAREALGHAFWIDMGMADAGVNILVVTNGHARVPSKVQ